MVTLLLAVLVAAPGVSVPVSATPGPAPQVPVVSTLPVPASPDSWRVVVVTESGFSGQERVYELNSDGLTHTSTDKALRKIAPSSYAPIRALVAAADTFAWKQLGNSCCDRALVRVYLTQMNAQGKARAYSASWFREDEGDTPAAIQSLARAVMRLR